MGVILTFRPRLPYPLVGTLPIVQNVVAEAEQRLLHVTVELATMKRILCGCIDYFPVNIELQLTACPIANADG